MKIKLAFDLDGVLREADIGFFRLCQDLGWKKTEEALYLKSITKMKPLLNPFLFATKNDEVYVVTNATKEWSVNLKKGWIKHFLGDRVKVIITQVGGSWGKEYVDAVAEEKIKLMEKEGIEVYFDDDPAVVRKMRELTDKIKVLRYGSWTEEYY